MIERIYVEIGNLCNLNCSFCPGTKRPERRMTVDEFRRVLEQISPHTDYIYLHVMGEPLLHPDLDGMLELIGSYGKRCCITTNGTLLSRKADTLLSHSDILHKVSVSLHAPEGNGIRELDDYLSGICSFARRASKCGVYTVFRLWNEESESGAGQSELNPQIVDHLKSEFPEPWLDRGRGQRIYQRVFLEYDGVFRWPKENLAEGAPSRDEGFCHGLLRQMAILADGTVTPCCLDPDGDIPLGNIFESDFDHILNSPRAVAMRRGLMRGELVEELCKKCTYSKRFSTGK